MRQNTISPIWLVGGALILIVMVLFIGAYAITVSPLYVTPENVKLLDERLVLNGNIIRVENSCNFVMVDGDNVWETLLLFEVPKSGKMALRIAPYGTVGEFVWSISFTDDWSDKMFINEVTVYPPIIITSSVSDNISLGEVEKGIVGIYMKVENVIARENNMAGFLFGSWWVGEPPYLEYYE